MPEIITPKPKPTKGTGILRFSEDIYLKFEYDIGSEEVIRGVFHYGEYNVELLPAIA